MGDEALSGVPADHAQHGARTRGKFDYQDHVTVLLVAETLLAGTLASVLVEYGADLTVEYVDGGRELVSVKSRDPNQRGDLGWSWSAINRQKVLRHLYELWERAEPGTTATVRTDAGLQGTACRLAEVDDAPHPPELLAAVAASIDEAPERAAEFLSSFAWPRTPMPGRQHIESVAIDVLRRFLTSLDEPAAGARAAFDALVDLVRKTGSGDPRERENGAPVRENADRSRQRLHEGRRLTRERLVSVILDAVGDLAENPPALRADPTFIGHAHLLEEIEDALRPEGALVAIVGPPGAGKTSIALEIGARLSEGLVVRFVDGADPEHLSLMLAGIAGRALDADVPSVPGGAGDLVIIDGVTDPSTVAPYLRAVGAARVLLTSTTAQLGPLPRVFGVQGLGDDDALSYLLSEWSGIDAEQARSVVEATGGNPLALSQAVGAARLTGLTPERYLDALDESPGSTLGVSGMRDPDHTVSTSIRLAVSASHAHDPDAVTLLRVMATCGGVPIDLDRLGEIKVHVLLPGADFLDREQLSQPAGETRRFLRLLGDKGAFLRMVNVLISGSHIRLFEGRAIVHPLIRRFVLDEVDDLTVPLETALSSFGDLFLPQEGSGRNLFADLSAVESILALCRTHDVIGPGYFAAAHVVSQLLPSVGRNGRALQLADDARQWMRLSAASGQQPPETVLLADFWYAEVLSGAGRYDDAKSVLRDVLAELDDGGDVGRARRFLWRRRRHEPGEHLVILRADVSLALIRIAAETFDVELLRVVVLPDEVDRERLPVAAQVKYLVAGMRVAWMTGDIVAGRRTAAEARLLIDAGAVTDIGAAAEIHLLSAGLDKYGSPERRAKNAAESIELFLRAFGDDAALTLPFGSILLDAADAHLDTGSFDVAAGYLDRAVRVRERFPDAHVFAVQVDAARARTMLNTAMHALGGAANPQDLRRARGLLNEAKALYAACVPAAEADGDFPAADLPALLVNYASTLAQLGEFVPARRLAVRGRELDIAHLGAEHPEVAIDQELIDAIDRELRLGRR